MTYSFGISPANKELYKASHEHDWEACKGSYYDIIGLEKAKKIRCPVCNKRIQAQTIDVEPYGDPEFIFRIPRHKPKKK